MLKHIPLPFVASFKVLEFSLCVKFISADCFSTLSLAYILLLYRQPGGTFDGCQLFRSQLDKIRNKHKVNSPTSVHVLGYFNFDNVWPYKLKNKIQS